jgi:hypothetical protein
MLVRVASALHLQNCQPLDDKLVLSHLTPEASEQILLPQQTIEALLSLAHVQAIAGRAGISVSYFDVDYGFDGTFRSIKSRGARLVTQGLAVDFQLKASINYLIEPEFVVYDNGTWP